MSTINFSKRYFVRLSSLEIESWNEFCQEKFFLRSGLILKWMTNDGAVILVERPPTPFSDALMSFLLKKRTCNIFQAKHLYSSVILQKSDGGQICNWSNQTCSRVSWLFVTMLCITYIQDPRIPEGLVWTGVIWGRSGVKSQNHSVWLNIVKFVNL